MLSDVLASSELPVFTVNPDQVNILKTPHDLYTNLLGLIKNSQKRIVLSTLYIGTGALEVRLVDAIEQAIRKRNVQVLILLDASRGLRHSSLTHSCSGLQQEATVIQASQTSATSSCSLLSPLTSYPGVSVALYHNPDLRGWLYSLLPNRLNEVIGVQHIKAYVVDDSVLLTGANLSHEYFTKRQDRAWVFERLPALADFYSGLVRTVSRFCYHLTPSGIPVPLSLETDPKRANLKSFKDSFRNAVATYLDSVRCFHPVPPVFSHEAYLIPLVQCGPFGIRTEECFTTRLLQSVATAVHKRCRLSLASGYFNLTRAYENLLVDYTLLNPESRLELLCASPSANGFLNSPGLSGYIPMAYRESLIKLLSRFHCTQTAQRDSWPLVSEYGRPEWTFHAKGIWIEERPCVSTEPTTAVTLIGSSNLSYRSLNRDLESLLVVWTKSVKFKQRILEEKDCLFSPSDCLPVTLTKLVAQSHLRLPWYLRFLHPFLHTLM
ncbi:CDP-diacylglycerol---glycerol-3-phosphate 3-phosphatidyltransferase [Paragonimus westermani]|uniref:CDP-diacylglycerol--glycerol-3-phosphate 3-phosphatidyltransferase n=1 Tax=Paragonimus westermani TaxID=34504 RepID=A0A5J4NPG4_9TREM|nr:CDP-diacylglycerol---glycerol-3-phosphate 3-phosphatidyltransferase [Paragonimus westermani]